MRNIEVGEYVRTIDGKIGVFIKYSSRKEDSLYKSPANCFIKLNNRKSDLQCFRDYIVKHSKNIIDLLEVGDYVNGREVLDKYIPKDIWEPIELRIDSKYMNFIISDEIKSIVTKEQFAQAEYKIKEDK